MILLGLLLLAATGAFTGLLIADNLSGGPDYTVTVLGNQIATMNSLAVFLSGIALALIFGLGLVMAMGGGARMRCRAAERRGARAVSRRAMERDALPDRTTETPVVPSAEGTSPRSPRPHRIRHMFGR